MRGFGEYNTEREKERVADLKVETDIIASTIY
jgi:hypothetical protein